RATVQRAVPLNITPRLLGQTLEPRGKPYPAPLHIRTHPQFVITAHWPQVGPTPRCVRNLPLLWSHSRAPLLFYYFGRVPPTWEVTWFFLLHGCCLTVEIVLKKALNDTWRLRGLKSGPLTTGFVMLTSFWLFFPQFLRCEAMVGYYKSLSFASDFRDVDGGVDDDDGSVEMGLTFGGFTDGNMLESLAIIF
ncbi:Wax synthase domain containing protein, partial [Trema orientale]